MHRALDKTRTEAFSDGVIAVIITIMVLELKVPLEEGWHGLRSLVPTLSVYLISFFFVGTYWVNHHTLLDRVRRVRASILWANLLFLFLLSLVPFFTEYMEEHHLNSVSVILYGWMNLAVGLGFTVLRSTIQHNLRQEDDLRPGDIAAEHKHWISLATYALSCGVAYLGHSYTALAMMAAVMILWCDPSFGMEACDEPAGARAGSETQSPRNA